MFQELKNEIKLGKKMYLFQLISLVLFCGFLFGADYIAQIIGIGMVNVILLGWMLINAVIIMIYMIIDYIKLLYKEIPSGENLGRTLLFKIFIFIFWFSINSLIFLSSEGMSIPVLALVLSFMIILFAKKTGETINRKMLIAIGCIWFVTLFLMFYFGYPLLIGLLMSIFNNQMVASAVVNITYFGLAIVCFLKVIKMTNKSLNDKTNKKMQTTGNKKAKKSNKK